VVRGYKKEEEEYVGALTDRVENITKNMGLMFPEALV
jgi:hypothetical protein